MGMGCAYAGLPRSARSQRDRVAAPPTGSMIMHTESLEIHRELATSVDNCFRHWMDHALLQRWWGPKDEIGRAFRAEIEA